MAEAFELTTVDEIALGWSEKEFQQWVVTTARSCGWLVFFTWNSRHSPYGEPDLRMCRPPRYIVAELKREGSSLTPMQFGAQELLRQCPGIETYLWWPHNMNEIEKVLQ